VRGEARCSGNILAAELATTDEGDISEGSVKSRAKIHEIHNR
jgi:hypothetical protein